MTKKNLYAASVFTATKQVSTMIKPPSIFNFLSKTKTQYRKKGQNHQEKIVDYANATVEPYMNINILKTHPKPYL